MRKLRRVGAAEDDPLDGVANFFDLGVIFALGFMVPLLARHALQDARGAATPDSARPTASAESKAPPNPIRVPRYRPSNDRLTGDGRRLGVAYRLASGEVVYVPDGADAPQATPSDRNTP